jgi:hypothetical protein
MAVSQEILLTACAYAQCILASGRRGRQGSAGSGSVATSLLFKALKIRKMLE